MFEIAHILGNTVNNICKLVFVYSLRPKALLTIIKSKYGNDERF